MAITAARATGDFSGFLNREQSRPFFEKAARASVIQNLVRERPMGYNGVTIPVVTGRLVAGWVSEGAVKPASQGSLGLVNMDPKKIAVIAVTTSEVVRANPGNYMSVIQDQVSEAFAQAFDRAAMYDQGPSALGAEGSAGGGPFSTYLAQTTKSVEIGTGADFYADVLSGLSLLVNAGKVWNGTALDDRLEPTLLGTRDGNERPLWIDSVTDTGAIPFGDADLYSLRRGRMMGRPAVMGQGVYSGTTADTEGWMGDWSKCAWGVVGGISYKLSDSAPVTINGALHSAFEENLIVIRAEAEYGFICQDPESFVALKNAS